MRISELNMPILTFPGINPPYRHHYSDMDHVSTGLMRGFTGLTMLLALAASPASGQTGGNIAGAKGFSLRDGTLWCGTSAVLQKVPTGFTIVKDPTRAGVF